MGSCNTIPWPSSPIPGLCPFVWTDAVTVFEGELYPELTQRARIKSFPTWLYSHIILQLQNMFHNPVLCLYLLLFCPLPLLLGSRFHSSIPTFPFPLSLGLNVFLFLGTGWINTFFFHFSGKYYLGENYCFPFISLLVQGMGADLIGAELMLMHRMRNDFQISLNCKNLNSGACNHHVSYKWTRELEVDEGNRFREGCSPRL